MSELYEIVFEDIPINNMKNIIIELIKNSNLPIFTFVGEEDLNIDFFSSSSENFNLIKNKLLEGYLLLGKLDLLNLDKVKIKNCNIRIFSYDEKVDLQINFEAKDVFSSGVKVETFLMEYCNKILEKYDIKNTYAGLDPASDFDTRIFTMKSLSSFSLQDFSS